MTRNAELLTRMDKDLLANVGSLMREAREEVKLTQRQAAAAAGSSQGSICNLEQGKSDVMLSTLNRWANVYGYQVEFALVPFEEESVE